MDIVLLLLVASEPMVQSGDLGWSDVLGPILQTGAIGAMLLIAIFAFIKKDKRLMDYQEKMQNEQREVNRRLVDEVVHSLSRIEQTTNAIRADQLARNPR